VNWTTVRLKLILSFILGIATKQVDNTDTILHAPFDGTPSWDDSSKEEKKRQEVYVCMSK